jgi:hypothetical protein
LYCLSTSLMWLAWNWALQIENLVSHKSIYILVLSFCCSNMFLTEFMCCLCFGWKGQKLSSYVLNFNLFQGHSLLGHFTFSDTVKNEYLGFSSYVVLFNLWWMKGSLLLLFLCCGYYLSLFTHWFYFLNFSSLKNLIIAFLLISFPHLFDSKNTIITLKLTQLQILTRMMSGF